MSVEAEAGQIKVFVVAALLWATACAQAGTGLLHGSVSSSTGETIASATIDIAVNGVYYGTTPLDIAGAYGMLVAWPGAGPANCELHSNVPGYLEKTIDTTLDDGGSAQVDFVLDRDTVFEDGFEPSL